MEIGDWSGTADLNDLYRDIRSRGLETNIAELDAFGFTVVPGALSAELTERLRAAVLREAERRFGRTFDVENEASLVGWDHVPYLLFKDPAFAEAVLNPPTLALITYLLGHSCRLYSMGSHFKGPGGNALTLHSDTANGMPAPFTAYSHVANCNFALTDYTEAKGALAMVPGSHRLCRQPVPSERQLMGNERNPDAIAVETPAGSAIIWHGNTWHGSFARLEPGLRINLAIAYGRQYEEVQEDYRNAVTDDFLERHGGRKSRMAQLLGVNLPYPWRDEGPDREKMGMNPRVGRTWHA